jgi:hypothetical protein
MKTTMIARLAAANPVPEDTPEHPLRENSARRGAIVVGLAAMIALPAVAFAGQFGNLLGISNEGTQVTTSDVLQGDSRLDEALQSMDVGATMQSLGTLGGMAFYATRNAKGDFCLAFEHVTDTTPGKGVLCDLNQDNFPSSDVKAISFPRTLLGVAADGVATVALVNANGAVLDSTPVVNNLFISDTGIATGGLDASYLETFDANGNLVTKQTLPPQQN